MDNEAAELAHSRVLNYEIDLGRSSYNIIQGDCCTYPAKINQCHERIEEEHRCENGDFHAAKQGGPKHRHKDGDEQDHKDGEG